jgi:carbonic anhydrase
LRRKHWAELDTIDDDARAARVAELNVYQSIGVLERYPAIEKAVLERGLTIHGLIYDLATGQLKVLEQLDCKASSNTAIHDNV